MSFFNDTTEVNDITEQQRSSWLQWISLFLFFSFWPARWKCPRYIHSLCLLFISSNHFKLCSSSVVWKWYLLSKKKIECKSLKSVAKMVENSHSIEGWERFNWHLCPELLKMQMISSTIFGCSFLQEGL